MNIRLSDSLAGQVRQLSNVYGYRTEEILSIGLALANVVLRESLQNNNQTVILDERGEVVGNFQVPLSQWVEQVVNTGSAQ